MKRRASRLAQSLPPAGQGWRGFTLVEALVALTLLTVVFMLLHSVVRHFAGGGRFAVPSLVDRLQAGKDTRNGIRQLMLRVGQGTEVLSPGTGFTDDTLVFRDLLNRKIRLRVSEAGLLSERQDGSRFVAEREVTRFDGAGRQFIVARPIRVPACTHATFTTVSPSCVFVTLTAASGQGRTALMSSIQLQNYAIATRGEKP